MASALVNVLHMHGEKTVSVHLTRIMAKLGAARRAEAVAIAFDRGLLEQESAAGGA